MKRFEVLFAAQAHKGKMYYAGYQNTTLGYLLQEALSELPGSATSMDKKTIKDFSTVLLKTYDKEMTNALSAKASSMVTFSGKLTVNVKKNDVWKLILESVTISVEETRETLSADKIKIVAIKSSLCPGQKADQSNTSDAGNCIEDYLYKPVINSVIQSLRPSADLETDFLLDNLNEMWLDKLQKEKSMNSQVEATPPPVQAPAKTIYTQDAIASSDESDENSHSEKPMLRCTNTDPNDQGDDNAEDHKDAEDDDDDEEDDSGEVSNSMVCLYDKVTKRGPKWCFQLTQGIMTINDKDYIFKNANGKASS